MSRPPSAADPIVLFVGNASSALELPHLDRVSRFYGFRLVVIPASEIGERTAPELNTELCTPVLVVLDASEVSMVPVPRLSAWLARAEAYGAPIALVGITQECRGDALGVFSMGTIANVCVSQNGDKLWVSHGDSSHPSFALRGVPFELGVGVRCTLEYQSDPDLRILASIGSTPDHGKPAMLHLCRKAQERYFITRTAPRGGPRDASEQLTPPHFGEIAPLFLLLREAGGSLCWQPAAVLANLTIDDPWLTEPYGCLSYPGLLEQMRRERFHATIGFVPWNFDRSDPEVVELFRANPDFFSIAVHGNNHDHYEFFRYEPRPGDQQRPKPLAVHAFNIRQALVRMESFRRTTGLDFDRVMVFPHGVCPAATFELLKQNGFWATSNYSNVPLGEATPVDPAVAWRSVNTEWFGFPALRRAYPQNYSEAAVAIDLFLGNPILFMAHQDLFFDGIAAFTPHAHRVNLRHPTVRWTSLGEISRHLHLLRWRSESRCDVRLLSRHAKIENQRPIPVEFLVVREEPNPEVVTRITIDGLATPWKLVAGQIQFSTTLAAGMAQFVEVHYGLPNEGSPVSVDRRGIRNRILRVIAEFRDLTLSHGVVGRLVTRLYYRRKELRSAARRATSRSTTRSKRT